MSKACTTPRESLVPLNVKIPIGLDEQLDRYCEARSIKKTQAIRLAIHMLLDQGAGPAEERAVIVQAIEHLDGTVRSISALAKLIKR